MFDPLLLSVLVAKTEAWAAQALDTGSCSHKDEAYLAKHLQQGADDGPQPRGLPGGEVQLLVEGVQGLPRQVLGEAAHAAISAHDGVVQRHGLPMTEHGR